VRAFGASMAVHATKATIRPTIKQASNIEPAEVLHDRVHDQEAGLGAGRRIEQRIIGFVERVLAALTDAKLQNIANIRLDFPMAVDVT
jgi:hypothetical protein